MGEREYSLCLSVIAPHSCAVLSSAEGTFSESSPNDLNAKQLPAGAAKWTIIGEIREETWGGGEMQKGEIKTKCGHLNCTTK